MLKNLKKYLPVWAAVSLIVFLLSLALYTVAVNVTPFADFLNSTVGTAVRLVLALVTSPLPFSLFELLLILALPLLILCVFLLVRRADNFATRVRGIASVLAVISLICTSYIFTLGVGYRTTALSDRLGIDYPSEISKEELYSVATLVRDEVNALAGELEYEGGESVMPYSLAELSRRLSAAYSTVAERYPFFTSYPSRVKPVALSTVMSDAGITGIYGFFTGEANLNVEYPDYNLPFVSAHEMAHQRGFSRENEANFMAFLVCISSDDAYIRYSGYLNMYEYLSSAVYRADSELYSALRAELSDSARSDILASRAVTLKHADSFIGKLNDRVNDTYLKLNGTEGTVSYSYIVRLAVGYYREMP